MKILFIVDTYPPNVNGASYATQRIIQNLQKAGQEMYVVAPSTSLHNYTKVEDGITVYRLRSVLVQKSQEFRVTPQILIYRRELKKIIAEVKPDILHINNPGFLGLAAIPLAKEFGITIVGTSHFMPENLIHYLHLPDRVEDMVNGIIWKRYAKWYSKLNAVISPTETAASLLKENGITTKTYILSNGIDMTRFKADVKSGDQLKSKYQLPTNVPIALFVGRLDKEKNIEVLIKAVGLIKKKAKFHVVIAGKGKEYDDLLELVNELGLNKIITFTGYLEDDELSKIYNVADIFIMPGIAELQSLVTMEAMATGLPIIAANAVALPHLVKDNRNGFLFKPGDEKDLSEKLLKLVNDEKMRKKFGEASLNSIKDHDMDEIIKKTIAIYESVYKQNKLDQLTYKPKEQRGRIRENVSRIRSIASRIVN